MKNTLLSRYINFSFFYIYMYISIFPSFHFFTTISTYIHIYISKHLNQGLYGVENNLLMVVSHKFLLHVSKDKCIYYISFI